MKQEFYCPQRIEAEKLSQVNVELMMASQNQFGF